MTTYFAFLRGINVSGQKIIKMDLLKSMFESLRFKNVRTYIQSGNVIFDAGESDPIKLEKKIEAELLSSLGYQVSVIVRAKSEMEEVIKGHPFDKSPDMSEKKYLTMLKQDVVLHEALPLFSVLKDVEIIEVIGKNFFCYSLPSIKGGYGFPNVFIEKHFKVPATTRNWNTIVKMTDLK